MALQTIATYGKLCKREEAKKKMGGSWDCKALKARCLDPLSRLIYPEERGDVIFDNKVDYIPSALQSKYF